MFHIFRCNRIVSTARNLFTRNLKEVNNYWEMKQICSFSTINSLTIKPLLTTNLKKNILQKNNKIPDDYVMFSMGKTITSKFMLGSFCFVVIRESVLESWLDWSNKNDWKSSLAKISLHRNLACVQWKYTADV